MQKTKMVFTVGPASETEEVLSQLIEGNRLRPACVSRFCSTTYCVSTHFASQWMV